MILECCSQDNRSAFLKKTLQVRAKRALKVVNTGILKYMIAVCKLVYLASPATALNLISQCFLEEIQYQFCQSLNSQIVKC